MIIHAKQNGAQMDTFAATSNRANIRYLRKTMAALGTSLTKEKSTKHDTLLVKEAVKTAHCTKHTVVKSKFFVSLCACDK